jgi:asparagine synthase (glutamine-hydrolysing)
MHCEVVLKDLYECHRGDGIEIHAAGCFYYQNEYYSGQKALQFLFDHHSSIAADCTDMNGTFAFIIKTSERVFACVDRVRSWPLYYRADGGAVTDNICRHPGFKQLDPAGVSEFISAGYTVGSRTLFRGFHSIQAGQYVLITQEGIQNHAYFTHHHPYDPALNAEAACRTIQDISDRWCERLMRSAEGRPIVVPLSGGYDSRYIVCMLKQHGCRNLLCYTYGMPGSYEITTAEAVAKKLGIQWHCIFYDKALWKRFVNQGALQGFSRFALHGDAVPCIQEVAALCDLCARGIIRKGSIVAPGYCGDLFGGSYLLPGFRRDEKYDAQLLTEYLLDKHFGLQKEEFRHEGITRDIERSLGFMPQLGARSSCLTYDEAASLNEEWFTRHKVSKFVVNACRMYEYMGLQWRLPLWDNDLTGFWYAVPNALRCHDKRLYQDWLFEALFVPMGVGFKKPESFHKAPSGGKMKAFLKGILAFTSNVLGLDLRPQSDFNGFHYLGGVLYRKVGNRKVLNPCKYNLTGAYALYCLESILGQTGMPEGTYDA